MSIDKSSFQEYPLLIIGSGLTSLLTAFKLVQGNHHVTIVAPIAPNGPPTTYHTCQVTTHLDTPYFQLNKVIGEQALAQLGKAEKDAYDFLRELDKYFDHKFGLRFVSGTLFSDKEGAIPDFAQEIASAKIAGIKVDNQGDHLIFHEQALLDSRILMQLLLIFLQSSPLVNIIDDEVSKIIKLNQSNWVIKTKKEKEIVAHTVFVATAFPIIYQFDPIVVQPWTTYVKVFDYLNSKDELLQWSNHYVYTYLSTGFTKENNRVIAIGGYDNFVTDPVRESISLQRIEQEAKKLNVGNELVTWKNKGYSTGMGIPYVGQDSRFNNLWVAYGYNGDGILYALIASKVIANKVINKTEAYEGLFIRNSVLSKLKLNEEVISVSEIKNSIV